MKSREEDLTADLTTGPTELKVTAHRRMFNDIIFRCSARGFQATCLQQMQGSVVEGLIISRTTTSGSQGVFVKLCPQLLDQKTFVRSLSPKQLLFPIRSRTIYTLIL